MAYDGLVTGAMAVYLNGILAGGRINKIYQTDKEELIFLINAGREKHQLYISANSGHARMHLIEEDKEQANPQNPTAFCMLLRKHFQSGRITSIQQVESERIIEIHVDHNDDLGFSVSKKLTVEIMGKHSNIIAIDVVSGKIIDSIKRITPDLSRYRQLLPGLPYVYPPDQNKVSFYTVSAEDLSRIMEDDSQSLPKALVSGIQGVSPAISQEICQVAIRAAGPETEALTAEDLHKVIKGMTDSIHTGDLKPVVYVDKDRVPMDFHVFPLSDAENLLDKIAFDNPSSAAEYYFSHKASSNRIRQKSADLTRTLTSALDKLYLKTQRLSEDLYAAENAEPYRIYGELLTANLHKISPGASKVTVLNYYDDTEVEITLDPRFSPSQNAQRYFRKYSKAKTAVREKKIQLEEANHSIGYLESVLAYVENAGTLEEIEEIRQELAEGGYLRRRKNDYRHSKSKLQPYAFTASDGSRILVGRNNKENDHLTLKTADKKDLWFHTKDIPGSHVILSTQGQKPTDEAMIQAASLAAYYSKARNSSNVPVDYTLVRYVKKPSGAKPGMVIYTDHKTLYVDPIKEL
ncbi:MAG: fibronectin/fibrinogen-binding protein [Clostridiales bacterium]|nr:fibronectin/fibrinogen-binding protein [Clostridiales bacterium]